LVAAWETRKLSPNDDLGASFSFVSGELSVLLSLDSTDFSESSLSVLWDGAEGENENFGLLMVAEDTKTARFGYPLNI
jgi:hypothetical protein